MANLADVISDLRARAVKLLAKSGQINEEETKSALITPMLRALGWDCEDPDQVRWEYRYKSQDNPVDYALFVGGRPRLFVEAKPLGRGAGDHRARMQAVNYANAAGVEWCVLTDGNFWQIYKSDASGDLESKLFLSTCLHSPDGAAPAYEPAYVLSLLSCDKLPENEIETLWTRLNVDRQGTQALQDSIREKDAGLVRLIQKRSALTKSQVLGFLDRARVSIDTQRSRSSMPAEESLSSREQAPDARQRAARKAWETRRRDRDIDTGSSPAHPKLPTQRELEMPLLRALLKRGGEVEMRSEAAPIDKELADQFNLDEKQRTACLANRKEKIWSNRIRWTRMALVKKGDLDGSRRGIWALTEQGRKRVQDS